MALVLSALLVNSPETRSFFFNKGPGIINILFCQLVKLFIHITAVHRCIALRANFEGIFWFFCSVNHFVEGYCKSQCNVLAQLG